MGCSQSKRSVEAIADKNKRKLTESIPSVKNDSYYPITYDDFTENEANNQLFLFGPKKCGKTTLWNNFKFIYLEDSQDRVNDYNEQDVKNYLIQIIVTLIESIKSKNILIEDVDNIILRPTDETILTAEYINQIKAIWHNPKVQSAYQENELNDISDNEKFFLDNIDRITGKNYVPTKEDILKSYIYTKCSTSYLKFKINNNIKTILIDNNYQNESEIIQYENIFKEAHYLVFIASLSDFDQFSTNNAETNKITETIKLFNQVVNSTQFQRKPIFLVLNKVDIISKKLKKFPQKFKEAFPDFEGDIENVDSCICHIKQKFLDQLFEKRNIESSWVEVVNCCAIDEKSVRNLFQIIIKKIIEIPKKPEEELQLQNKDEKNEDTHPKKKKKVRKKKKKKPDITYDGGNSSSSSVKKDIKSMNLSSSGNSSISKETKKDSIVKFIDSLPEREKLDDEISVYEYASGYVTDSEQESYTEYFDSSYIFDK